MKNYDRELDFVKELLTNFRLPFKRLSESITDLDDDTMGLRHILNYEFDPKAIVEMLESQCKSNTIYQLYTPLLCNYLLFRLPDTIPADYAYIGPYLLQEITNQDVYILADKFHVESGHLKQLEHYYQTLPQFSDDTMLQTILYTLGGYLWGNSDNFTIKKSTEFSHLDSHTITPLSDIQTSEEALLSMQLLEQRYDLEHKLSQAVSAGQTHKAELYFSQFMNQTLERRHSNPIRDKKNAGIILNTILRIAADKGNVHPIHIDEISSRYARKLELINSEAVGNALMKEMVRKYCLLVKNHSLKGYSLLVRKVITRINADLTADLSLKSQAAALNVNASYLSTLFKKETGTTLTEYVNRKRIEHAILLLNTTDMQIQMIAQYCGISDVNYFTKTFKKIIGKTPKEYREMINLLS